jgi:hypothetical protein
MSLRLKPHRGTASPKDSFLGIPLLFLSSFVILGWLQLNGWQVVLDFSKPSWVVQGIDAFFLMGLMNCAWLALSARSLSSAWNAFSFFGFLFAIDCALTGAMDAAFAMLLLGFGMTAWKGWFSASLGRKRL